MNADKIVQEKIQADEVAATLARAKARKAAEEERLALEEKAEQELKLKESTITPDQNNASSDLIVPKENNLLNITSVLDSNGEVLVSHPHSLPMTPLNANNNPIQDESLEKKPSIKPELNSI